MPDGLQRFRCEDEAREALLSAARGIAPAGVPGAASLSLRWPRSGAVGMLIVAAPVAATATADAVTWCALTPPAGRPDPEERRLPADWRLHRELLRQRLQTGAVVRCRPVFCMTLACSRRLHGGGIPAFHPQVAAAGINGIRCTMPVALDAPELAERVGEALGERLACLVADEGLLAVGSTLEAAVDTVATVETLAQVWWQLLQVENREADGVMA